MSGRRWTEAEDKYLRRWYPRKGGQWCAQKLGRSYGSVMWRLSKIEIGQSDTGDVLNGDVVLLAELAAELGVVLSGLIKRARLAGVLQTYREDGRRGAKTGAHVPLVWADALREERRAARKNARDYAHYMPAEDAAAALGVDKTGLLRWATSGRGGWLSGHMGDCHAIQKLGDSNHIHWAFNPQDIERTRLSIEQERRLARHWIPTKALAIELDDDPRRIKKLAKQLGADIRNLMVYGALTAYVHPDVAAKIRHHYGIREAA